MFSCTTGKSKLGHFKIQIRTQAFKYGQYVPPSAEEQIGNLERFEHAKMLCRRLGRFGSPMSDPSNPRMGFFPFKDRGFETFIRRDLIVRVRFLASLTFFRLVKTSTAAEK
jgi:hypothetical protein